MAIYEITADEFRKIDETSFSSAGVRERQDMQRLLRGQIEIVSPDTLIISEEFSQWEDSNRRIDLLGIDKDANLVVIELKRTEDGGHMELQAIRYAAMVSAMTFDRVTEVYSHYLTRNDEPGDARALLLDFLEWEEPDEDQFAQDVRVVLVSAEFSKELTTSVIWLNERGLDIRCIRIKPYRDGGRILADVQPIIPLPEAEDYRVRLKEKQQKERASRNSNRDYTKYTLTLDGQLHERLTKRAAMFTLIGHLIRKGHSPTAIAAAIPWRSGRMFRVADGTLNHDQFVATLTADAENGEEAFSAKRFYCSDDELFHVDGKTYCCTNQWGSRFQECLNALIETFPGESIAFEACD